jgi:hypothetical protein
MRSTSPIDDALRDLAGVLDALGLRWFLFGAQAAILYGSTRVTEDIDVTVELGGLPTRKLAKALSRSGFALRFAATEAFVDRTRVLPAIHASTDVPVDIVFAGPGLEELVIARIVRHEREGLSIPVVSPEDLVVLKILAGRPRDLEDARSVVQSRKASLDDVQIEETLALLEEALSQSDLLPLWRTLAMRRPPKGATKKKTKASKKRTKR